MERNRNRIKTFAQSIHLAMYKRYFDDIDSDDGEVYTNQVIDWTNQLLDELEPETDWNYVRQNNLLLGTAQLGARTISAPSDDIRKLVVNEYRPLTISQDGSPVSEWDVVSPNAISDPRDRNTRERVTFMGGTVIFSRPLKEFEVGGDIRADIINNIPRLSDRNIEVLDLVKPLQLLILGVAKNATLPDIVQGGISPSMTQKYADLLEKAIEENEANSISLPSIREDMGYVGGVV